MNWYRSASHVNSLHEICSSYLQVLLFIYFYFLFSFLDMSLKNFILFVLIFELLFTKHSQIQCYEEMNSTIEN